MEYKQYFRITLPVEELKKMNRYSPEGVKYCNAVCQDYREINEFSGNVTKKAICNTCRSIIGKVKKAIENKQMTLEDFKSDPHMFDEDKKESSVVATKYCTKCNEKKALNDFYEKKAICKACICISRAAERNNIEEYITDIDNLKVDLHELENYIKNICKDKLTCIISHYSIGRKSTDTKPKMIENIVNHFRKLQDVKLCRGGCGFILQEELSTCEECNKKNTKVKSHCGLRNATFTDCIDDIISELKPGICDNEFNKEQVFQMSRKLGIGTDKLKQTENKEKALKVLNDFLYEKEKEEKQQLDELLSVIPGKTSESEMILNGITVLAREGDGYINATALCRAGGKKFNHWYSLESTKELIRVLESEINNKVSSKNTDAEIAVSKLVDIKKGGNNKKGQGSWVHPDLAVQLAQWLSPIFSIQVSRWVREIALSGSVSVENTKTNEQLLLLQNEVLKTKEKYKELEKKHTSILYRRSLHKFNKGPIFYIISDGDSKSLKYKVGIDDVDINARLQQHRTSIPNLTVNYLIYTHDNRDLESAVLKRHKNARRPYMNHEWIFDTNLNSIIDSVQTFLKFIGSEYTIDEDIDKYNMI